MIHCKSTNNFRCGKCGLFFGSIKKINEHLQFYKFYKDENKDEEEEDDDDEEDGNKIKCSECNLFFDNVELMSLHFFQIMIKKINNKIKKRIINKIFKRIIFLKN